MLPHGLYYDSQNTTREEVHGDQLSIENLGEATYTDGIRQPVHLELCPLPLPDGTEQPSDMRLRQVSLCFCLCSCLCTSYQPAASPLQLPSVEGRRMLYDTSFEQHPSPVICQAGVSVLLLSGGSMA